MWEDRGRTMSMTGVEGRRLLREGLGDARVVAWKKGSYSMCISWVLLLVL